MIAEGKREALAVESARSDEIAAHGWTVTSVDRVLVAGGRGRAQVSRVPASTVPSFER